MTDQPIQKTQTQITTDIASLNSYGVVTLSDGQTVNVQITMRNGATAEHMKKNFDEYIKFLDIAARDYSVKFWDGKKSEANPAAPASGESKYNDHAGTYDDPREFEATLLAVTYDKGKEYFKVHGQEGKFPKFPVAIWQEVIEKAGISLKEVDPKSGYNLTGWTAKYILNDKGNPGKVISLVKPDFA